MNGPPICANAPRAPIDPMPKLCPVDAPWSPISLYSVAGTRKEGNRMYGWIWRHLPGNAWVRALISLLLVLAVVYILFQYVFPWAEPLLPFNDVTVDDGMTSVQHGVAAVR